MVGHRQKHSLSCGDDGFGQPKRRVLQTAASASGGDPNVVASCLLEKWSWGQLSAPGLQGIAHCMKLAGDEDPDIDNLASLGSYGINQGHVHRDLVRISNLMCWIIHICVNPLQSTGLLQTVRFVLTF